MDRKSLESKSLRKGEKSALVGQSSTYLIDMGQDRRKGAPCRQNGAKNSGDWPNGRRWRGKVEERLLRVRRFNSRKGEKKDQLRLFSKVAFSQKGTKKEWLNVLSEGRLGVGS